MHPQRIPYGDGYIEILEELGRGALGVVYKGRQNGVKINRFIALKMLLPGLRPTKEELTRFHTEASIISELAHPNVVQIYGDGVHNGQTYFVLQYVSGGNLATKIGEQPQSPRAAAELVQTLARAVHAIHEQGIIHRDLKPANVLLTPEGVPMITDFGLAKHIRRKPNEWRTDTGVLLGTASYMAPEQAKGRADEHGRPVDVYALGAILYKLLTGRPPFLGESQLDTVLQAATEEPLPPRTLQPKIPLDLQTICLKCLDKDPRKRYASACALADDLERFRAGKPIQARRVSPVEKTWRWCRRNPAVAALIVAIAVVLLAGTGISSYFAFEAQKRATESVERLYISNMRLAQQAWDEGQMEWLQELLTSQLPKQTLGTDLRHFEWHYWQRLCHADLLTLEGHTAPVCAVAFSPDGKWLASGGDDGTVRIWDAGNGKEISTLNGQGKNSVESVAFSRDGQSLVSASIDGSLKVWDLASGKARLSINDHSGTTRCIVFSPDGRRLASGGELGGLRFDAVRDLSASALGQMVSPLGQGPLLLAFETVARRTMGKVSIWDVVSGKKISTLEGHTEEVSGIAFSPDGGLLASGSVDGTARIWDAASGQEVLPPLRGQAKWIRSLAFSPSGKLLVTAGGGSRKGKGEVIIWDVRNGQRIRTLLAHTQGVSSVAFSPDGRHVVSGSQDQSVRIWDVDTGEELLTLKGHVGPIRCVAFSPDGQRVASASEDKNVKIWDAISTKEAFAIARPGKHVYGVAFGPDGKRLAWGGELLDQPGGELGIWDPDQKKGSVCVLGRHTQGVIGVAFSPNGQYLASAHEDHTVRIWDIASRKEIHRFTGHTGIVWSVAFSPDGQRLASASMDQTIRLWDPTTGQEQLVLKTESKWVSTVAFSPDGSFIASADNTVVKIWNATSGQEIHALRGHTHTIWSVAFSPNGKLLAAAGNDGTVRIWDTVTGQPTAVLKGHTNNVSGVAFSPDGRRLASSSVDQTVKLWDVASGQETLTLKGHKDWVFSVAFSPDGNQLASGSHDGTVRIWDATPLPSEKTQKRLPGPN